MQVACSCCLLPGAFSRADSPESDFSPEELVVILRDLGYTSVSTVSDKIIKFKMDGDNIGLMRFDDGDLQLFFIVRGASCTPSDLNTWNRTRRLSRSYLDDEDRIFLESDLLSDAGLTRDQVQAFVKVFNISRATFRHFLHENC